MLVVQFAYSSDNEEAVACLINVKEANHYWFQNIIPLHDGFKWFLLTWLIYWIWKLLKIFYTLQTWNANFALNFSLLLLFHLMLGIQ